MTNFPLLPTQFRASSRRNLRGISSSDKFTISMDIPLLLLRCKISSRDLMFLRFCRERKAEQTIVRIIKQAIWAKSHWHSHIIKKYILTSALIIWVFFFNWYLDCFQMFVLICFLTPMDWDYDNFMLIFFSPSQQSTVDGFIYLLFQELLRRNCQALRGKPLIQK